jgi:hypothetical protein
MAVCALCHQLEADKKGSHLVPHFLMKRIDNADNKPGRDQELGFELGTGKVRGYFGRNVTPEKLEDVYGELSDEEIADSRSSMIVDHLLCNHCEARLAKVESAYSAALNAKGEGVFESFGDGFVSLLFWISIFWRMSASEDHVFKLHEDDEQHLRIILDGGMDVADAKAYIEKLGTEAIGISYQLLRSIDYTTVHAGFTFFRADGKRPYSAMIGEFAVFLEIDGSKADTSEEEFFGLNANRNAAPYNDCTKAEMTLSVSHDDYKAASALVVDMYKEDFLKELNEDLDTIHKKLMGNGTMAPEIKQEIIAEITSDNLPLGRRYTTEAMVEAITKVLMRH